MIFDSFIRKIPDIKEAPLLAEAAHIKMAPLGRAPYLKISEDLKLQSRKSAVMMLFYPKGNQTHLVLIERAAYKGVHSAQIAFPGGKWEEQDKDLRKTALRETEEEIGIDASKIEIIRSFTQIYIPPSNFLVAPFMGVLEVEPKFVPDSKEVAKIIEFPIEALFEEDLVHNILKTTSYANDLRVPAYVYSDIAVWGATAMMMSELKETLALIYNY